MSRGISPRVNSYGGPLWILVIFAASAMVANSYSCHEVKTAFQLRQVGPLSRVPETPRTGEEPSSDSKHVFFAARRTLSAHSLILRRRNTSIFNITRNSHCSQLGALRTRVLSKKGRM